MKKHGSDKSLGWHNYTEKYFNLFNNIKFNKLNIFELGLGTNNLDIPSNMGKHGVPGASLRGWKEYFPNSQIYGADIDSRILFEEDRIKTFYVDQTKKESIQNLWKSIDVPFFDIMLDDGLHELNANMCMLDNSFHKLKENGFYIIEDIIISEKTKYELNLKILKTKYKFNYEIVELNNQYNSYDNCLVIVKR
jgi:hypothetical protein